MNHNNQSSSLQFAQEIRNSLRSSQAKSKNIFRIDNTAYELILEIAWRVAEKIS